MAYFVFLTAFLRYLFGCFLVPKSPTSADNTGIQIHYIISLSITIYYSSLVYTIQQQKTHGLTAFFPGVQGLAGRNSMPLAVEKLNWS